MLYCQCCGVGGDGHEHYYYEQACVPPSVEQVACREEQEVLCLDAFVRCPIENEYGGQEQQIGGGGELHQLQGWKLGWGGVEKQRA